MQRSANNSQVYKCVTEKGASTDVCPHLFSFRLFWLLETTISSTSSVPLSMSRADKFQHLVCDYRFVTYQRFNDSFLHSVQNETVCLLELWVLPTYFQNSGSSWAFHHTVPWNTVPSNCSVVSYLWIYDATNAEPSHLAFVIEQSFIWKY